MPQHSFSLTSFIFFFFNDTATTEIYTLSLHDALPISTAARQRGGGDGEDERAPRRRRPRGCNVLCRTPAGAGKISPRSPGPLRKRPAPHPDWRRDEGVQEVEGRRGAGGRPEAAR